MRAHFVGLKCLVTPLIMQAALASLLWSWPFSVRASSAEVAQVGPALAFGPVNVRGGVAVRQCAMNLGARPIKVTTAVLKSNLQLALRADELRPGEMACLEYPMPSSLAGNIVGLTFTAGPDSEKALRSLAASLQVVEASGAVLAIVNPALLPEVQTPAAAR